MKKNVKQFWGVPLVISFVVVVSFALAFTSIKIPGFFQSFNTALTSQDRYSLLSATRASYSLHQPHSHSQFTVQSSKATLTPPTPTPVTTPVVVPTPTPAPIPVTSPVVAPTPTPVTVPTSPAVTTPQTGGFGISVGATLYPLSDQDLNAELSDMVSLGVSWVRFDFEWDQIQAGGSTSFNWVATDRVVAAVLAHNLKILPVVAYSPAWARPAGCTSYMCGPNNSDDYANFAKALVTRYASQGIHQWEIWNEPNITQFWLPQPNPASYASMLKAAYIAIKSVDSSATVISAGLSPAATTNGNIAPLEFLTSLYQDGAEPYFDALGFHPYSYPAFASDTDSWNAWAQMSITSTNLRSIMTNNGDSAKQIWLTEYGAPTGGPGAGATLSNPNFGNAPDHVDEALQASMYSDAISLWRSDSWAGPLFLYSYKDIGTSASTNENFFGLLRNDGSQKPAYSTIKQLLSGQ